MAHKTFRRDKLRRLIEAGKVVAVGSYHFDDMTGEARSQGISTPVAMKPADWRDRKEGVFYVSPWDFDSKSGSCWQSENGVITLYVHSNSHYDFRLLA